MHVAAPDHYKSDLPAVKRYTPSRHCRFAKDAAMEAIPGCDDLDHSQAFHPAAHGQRPWQLCTCSQRLLCFPTGEHIRPRDFGAVNTLALQLYTCDQTVRTARARFQGNWRLLVSVHVPFHMNDPARFQATVPRLARARRIPGPPVQLHPA